MTLQTTAARTPTAETPPAAARKRSLFAACSAHAVHDGLTDVVYVLLPLWQSQFAISYAMVGMLRGSYSGVMAGCQLLAGRLARRWGRKALLVGGTALAGSAYLLASQAGHVGWLLLALVLGGLGASTQHPLASSLVAESYEDSGKVKQALSNYNFAGDIGKTLIPGLLGLLLVVASWEVGTALVGLLGLAAALLLWRLIPADTGQAAAGKKSGPQRSGSGKGLWALLGTGTIDSAVRMGFLTFLPFLLQGKGAGTAATGVALSLLFVGGAFGKLLCGYLGARIGMMKTVWVTEATTALCIVLAIWLPLTWLMSLLPLLGLALNGTSSVLYGAVPELAEAGKRDQAFARFYTGTIGAGALAPILFGRLGDLTSIPSALQILAGLLLLTLPLSWCVQRAIERNAAALGGGPGQ